MSDPRIPIVDLSALYDLQATVRDREEVAEALGRACSEIGFAYLRGSPLSEDSLRRARREAGRFFDQPESQKARVATRAHNPESANRYRGYFPVAAGDASRKEGFEIGVGEAAAESRGLFFAEDNPWPDRGDLSGFRESIEAYGAALERLGRDVLRLFADYLGTGRAEFEQAYSGSISTLRLIRYPEGSDQPVEADGARVSTPSHTDSGVLTLLNQDETGGLQVLGRDGRWIDAAPIPETLVMNAGDLLELWTGGRLRATQHRVLAPRGQRISVPFFFEPAPRAEIRPLWGQPATPAAPVVYADYVLDKMKSFVEYRDLVADPGW
jgi:isopenicillin N synthase-like dioxygenase